MGKGKKYFIISPNSFHYGGNDYEPIFGTEISASYKSSHITIPVRLKFKVNGEFDGLKLFDTLRKEQPDTEHLMLDEYVINVFKKLNQPGQEAIDRAAEEYAKMEISAPELLSRVIELVYFPENIFPNVTDVQICLGQPETSSCKGMACGS